MKIAIAGYGVEGAASFVYWNHPDNEVTIVDEKQPNLKIPEGIKSIIHPDAFKELNGYDLVVRTASLRPDKISTNGNVWSATNEFFAKCPAPIIGVTGTKGKGTTASLITIMLKEAGKNVHLVGNIGVPALEVLPVIKRDDIVVFELSSFQLWDLHTSPQTAVVLMIEPDHMDVHASLQEYVDAKAQIAIHQNANDLMVYHPENQLAQNIALKSKAKKVKFNTSQGAQVVDERIIIEDQVLCKTSEVGLLGEHNLENVCAAVTAVWHYTTDIPAVKRAILSFKGLPHRLQLTGDVAGVKYINDSFSSAPGATIAAIRSFDEPEILICGGYDRGLSFDELVLAIIEQQNIKKVLLIGQTAQKIYTALRERKYDKVEILNHPNMFEIVTHAQNIAEKNDVVILSPGCPSFDMFKDFKDRGEQFMRVVEQLK